MPPKRLIAAISIIAVFAGIVLLQEYIPKWTSKSHPKAAAPNTVGSAPASINEVTIAWGNLGMQLMEKGVIDRKKLEALYEKRGGLSQEQQQWISPPASATPAADTTAENATPSKNEIKITEKNATFALNMLWAFGLANKNEILEKGEMTDPEYGGAGNFASTGGWTLAKGDSMDHYSKYEFIKLTPGQQSLVDRVSRNIYRPCCGNSTHFPDCNHGMAMLGFLEILASQNTSEEEMYRAALVVNSFWFPDTYRNIAKYFREKENLEWKDVDPKKALGKDFSSGQGYSRILKEIEPVQEESAGGCSV